LPNPAILRAELHRLFRWLKDKDVSAVVTAERGDGTMTRFGLEEYVADCVILLDHRVTEQMSTRRLRIVKYRGTLHGTNEYPFLLTKDGISVLPITSIRLDHQAPTTRVSSGVKGLDDMLGGKGYYRSSSILLSGTAGTGKSSLAAAFVDAACRRGERCLYFAFEESPSQILRNMRSIGIDLAPHVKKGLLQFHAARPTLYGLEMHLVTMHNAIKEHKPEIVVLDPITDFFAIGSKAEVKATITRIIDFLKTNQITALFTSYISEEDNSIQSVVGVSSLIDTWVSLRNLEVHGERHRGLFVLKSRGMAHSNQMHSFRLTNDGIQIGPIDIIESQTEFSTT
jgi:circadian clock protein KaiC